MSKMDVDELEEKPLDPEVEKVRRKMVRLLAVSIGIMIIGVMAVLAAVVYKITEPGDDVVAESPSGESPALAPPSGTGRVNAALPQGFSVEHVALDGGQALFYGRDAAGDPAAHLVDLQTGAVVTTIGFAAP